MNIFISANGDKYDLDKVVFISTLLSQGSGDGVHYHESYYFVNISFGDFEKMIELPLCRSESIYGDTPFDDVLKIRKRTLQKAEIEYYRLLEQWSKMKIKV